MHCTTPLTDSSLTVHCSASSSTSYCPARFCNRLCHTRAQRVHPLLCNAQNPASAPLIKFARASSWMGLSALSQCTARLLLDHAVQGEDAKTFEDEWKVVGALATLGMEERSKNGWYVDTRPRSPRHWCSCYAGRAAPNLTRSSGRKHTSFMSKHSMRLVHPPTRRNLRDCSRRDCPSTCIIRSSLTMASYKGLGAWL